jgi:hypothetical protein
MPSFSVDAHSALGYAIADSGDRFVDWRWDTNQANTLLVESVASTATGLTDVAIAELIMVLGRLGPFPHGQGHPAQDMLVATIRRELRS